MGNGERYPMCSHMPLLSIRCVDPPVNRRLFRHVGHLPWLAERIPAADPCEYMPAAIWQAVHLP